MRRGIILGLLVVTTASGCARLSGSPLNPLNWFGGSRERVETAPDPAQRRPLVPEGRSVQIVDGRGLVAQVTEMRIERTPYGALVRATGVTPTQGYFNAQLVPVGFENGTLVLDFRAEAPAGFEAQGSARSRQITAAYVIEATDLPAIRRVQVRGAQNSRVSSR